MFSSQYSLYGNNPQWFPYMFFGTNILYIGYETSNNYGVQLKITHRENNLYIRTRINSTTWSDWVEK